MTRSLSLLPTLAAVVLVASGCTNEEPGVAEPGPPSGSSMTTSGTSQESTEPLSASVDPCAVITPEEDFKQYGNFSPRQETSEDMASARVCSWKRDKQDPLDDRLIIGLAVRDDQSVDTVNDVGGGVNTGLINKREAAEAPNPVTGGCTLAVAIEDHSRVDINVLSEDVNDACDIAREVAYLVEPRLPKA